MQLIVVGMHRSGTSVLARLLNLMGVYFAPEGMGTGANQENPKGFWERRDVRALNDFVLHGMGCDWNRISRFEVSAVPAPLLAEFDKRAAQIVLAMDASRPWLMKEPRLCLLLPLWRRVLEAPVCLHIIRHPVEVASSLRTRNQIPMEAGLALWEAYNRSAVEGMAGLPQVVVQHRRLMEDAEASLVALHGQLEALDVRRLVLPAAKEVASFVNDELYREREGQRGLEVFAAARQLKLFERWIAGKALPKSDKGLAERERETLAAYEAALPPLAAPAPKKPTEAELREKIAAGEREIRALKEDVQHTRALLGQREQQAAFVEVEFSALREAHAAREAMAGELAAGLQKMLRERDAWLQEKDRSVEFERASATSREQSLRADLAAIRVEQEAGRHAFDAERVAATEREQALRDGIEALETALAKAEAECAAWRDRASEHSRELVQLTRLYADVKRAESMLRNKAAEDEAALAVARTHLSQVRAAHTMLQERHAHETRTLSERLVIAERALQVRSDEAGLLRDANALHAAELARQEQRLADLHASTSWKLTAPVRRLRALMGGGRGQALAESCSIVELLRRSRWFDADWYAANYADVADSGLSAEMHYLVRGASEARNPSPDFDTRHYLASNTDVSDSGQNPLLHFILHGEAEGRSPAPGRDA